MTFDEVLDQVRELLRQRGRLTYGAVKRRFDLDEAYLEDLKGELIRAEGVAADEDGDVLVWTGGAKTGETAKGGKGETAKPPTSSDARPKPLNTRPTDGERRQLTVMFCDLVDSTVLSTRLDPEELREVVSAYHETCAGAISRYGGHTAQHLGDGLLVYFGYPVAHEDDAQRAVRTGLEILAELSSLNARLPSIIKARLPHPVQVRIGVHTGLVVIGELGSSDKREILALGETPNIAARVQGQAEPNTIVMSAATSRLVQGLFECQDLGPQTLKGISTPLSLYRVMAESAAQSRFEVAVGTGLTPLVGREEELGLLQQRWTQAKDGAGQVVLLSGEPGIGKSRLVQELKEHVNAEGATRIEFRCSPYHQNSALYPIIDHLQRLLQFAREDAPATKLEKLQHTLNHYRFPQADTFPLLASLLSLPHPEGYLPITVSPQKQKEKTQAALVAWLVEEAEQAAVLCAWEDLHWADPSTLEVLTLLLDQAPTTRLLALLTSRPEFISPWGSRSYLTQLTLSRLGRPQVEAMIKQVAAGKPLPAEVVEQIRLKTDGVPLFVEELTKSVVESVGATGRSPLQFAIPATLQDSLMARLDRLNMAKELAQLGATLGREFSYELLHAVSPLDEGALQQGLRQLVEAELLYQRRLPPQATYLFKHALVQDTAYQSLLKSKRQHYHQQIAQVLAEQFPETQETQPELVAHHYTEARLIEQAIPYWQRAGQKAAQRSATVEAISHLTKGLELLKTLPDTPERAQQELTLQVALGAPLQATKGYSAPEVEQVYTRARELCRRLGETPQLFPVLWGLCAFSFVQAEMQQARELGEQCLTLAQHTQNPALLVNAHHALGQVLFYLGEAPLARKHFEQCLALYEPQKHNPRVSGFVQDPGVTSLTFLASILWRSGYPDQALKSIDKTLTLAQELSHPLSLVYALNAATSQHLYRREAQLVQERAEALMALSDEHGFPHFWAAAIGCHGWALAKQGQAEEGIAQLRRGIAAKQTIGSEIGRPFWLALLAEALGKGGEVEEGWSVLTEALERVNKTEERIHETQLYQLKGELLLMQEGKRERAKGKSGDVSEAEACFHKVIEIARKQQAKSLELRAVMSLSRLWQRQGKKKEAHGMLSEVYNWFTEGFDTKDLQEAKALIEELGD